MDGDDASLPEWNNWGEKLKKGASLWLCLMVYLLPLLLLVFLPVLIIIISSALGASSRASILLMLISFFLMIVTFIFYLLYLLSLYLIIPAITVRYISTESISETLNIKEMISMIRTDFVQLLILAAFLLLAGFISQIGIILFIVGVFFVGFYAQLMLYHLYGQFAASKFV